ncbi:unnamed protein product [Ranitomeya imitator]|uniref:Uncharacterized protein n=1 Tax=Ranitomeya imitator TaxID=111125 RepID=A0ABN9KY62_9NEOB|nr:unnamed protein product [Ranitomeya imitator]
MATGSFYVNVTAGFVDGCEDSMGLILGVVFGTILGVVLIIILSVFLYKKIRAKRINGKKKILNMFPNQELLIEDIFRNPLDSAVLKM